MNMIRHDDESIEKIVSEDVAIVMNSFHYHVCNSRLAQIGSSGPGLPPAIDP